MKRRRLYISQLFAVLMLCVFSIALVPWATLHHHEEEIDYCNKYGRVCMHKAHVSNERHSCLICSAHFEKDFVTVDHSYRLVVTSSALGTDFGMVRSSYAALIRAALRGPPAIPAIFV